eukprot:4810208-Ditylum_brightwellii.AAC.1
MVGFVDDATGQTIIFESNDMTPDMLIAQMQHNAQLCSNLLWILGGLLELDKCSYHSGIEPNQQGPPLLQVRQADINTQIDIKYKSPYTPHTSLGHFKAPGGNGAIQLKIFKTSAHQCTIKVITSAPTHVEAR